MARRQWRATKSTMAGQLTATTTAPTTAATTCRSRCRSQQAGGHTSPVLDSPTTEVAPVVNYAVQRPSTSAASMTPPHPSPPPPKILHRPALLPPCRRRSPPPKSGRRPPAATPPFVEGHEEHHGRPANDHHHSPNHMPPPSLHTRRLPLNCVNLSLSPLPTRITYRASTPRSGRVPRCGPFFVLNLHE
jgi:hypothetical protein